MAQALYRKWRSQTFDEVVGQEHVTTTLLNALREGRVAHAYLFAGPRGTGKTSTARILAKALNCTDEENQPCNRCSHCTAINEGRMLDLIEIDAASNNSVDDVRELREKVGFQPSESRYKVYIIDEVHMLSASAFNALLKTLEEPPPYARFVLATTEPHRIPATVLSRCQRFDFRRIPVAEIAAHLTHVAGEEGFEVQEPAIFAIARSAQGCMRDAVSLLDQMTSYGAAASADDSQAISLEQVQQVLGSVAGETVAAFVDALAAKNVSTGLELIHDLLLQGGSLNEFAAQVIEHLRGVMLVQMVGDSALLEDAAPDTVQTMKKQASEIGNADTLLAIKRFSQAMTELKGGFQPQLPLELALVELIEGVQQQVPAPAPAQTGTRTASPASPPQARTAAQPAARPGKSSVPEQTPAASLDAEAMQRLRDRWGEFMNAVRDRCGHKQQASLRSIRDLAIGGNAVAIAFGNNTFSQKMISEAKTKDAVSGILAEILGQQITLICQGGEKATIPSTTGQAVEEPQTGGPDPLLEYAVSELGAKVSDSRPESDRP
ncbi:MAG: DNA polymerase III subunit gamma/tau [Caldilineaceae bacterium SB0661_bin_32]|uniref:DNA polymerase III subunit gamma/tau n=1 Tax=Caldilineaceae bacterium SB0661_bin_32 TaxID=2605255 RepID=A0A6B1D6Z0_9CHLR|nr:DNA polymerase III subunit gamma/tau [Caldilineaceae bacterium SB0661_bin_32]